MEMSSHNEVNSKRVREISSVPSFLLSNVIDFDGIGINQEESFDLTIKKQKALTSEVWKHF